MMKRSISAALLSAAVLLAAATSAPAATFAPTTVIKAGTKIACVLDGAVNSTTLSPGSSFKLKVVDPNQPALQGAEINGTVTDVKGPGGLDRARIGFVLDNIVFADGSKAPIRAHVLSRNVTYTNSAATASSRMVPPPVPNGTVTPGPIAFQIRLGGGDAKPAVGPSNTGLSGGYVYAQGPNEPIIIPQGTAVTIQLENALSAT